MGKWDQLTGHYLQDPQTCADFLNGFIYGGREVISAENLSELDVNSIAVLPNEGGISPQVVKRARDILKRAVVMKDSDSIYLILGIENQMDVHYAMPVRNLLYNALSYTRQVEEIAEHNRKHKLCDSREFLSGFRREDKLVPVITITLYWGEQPWDGPLTLKELLQKTDEETEALIDDFRINLFSITDCEEFPEYRTELRELFEVLRARKNMKELLELMEGNPRFASISRRTAEMIQGLTGIPLPEKDKEGRYNMATCTAVEQLREEGRELGRSEGLELGRSEGLKLGRSEGLELGRSEGLELGRSEGLDMIKMIMIKMNKTAESAMDFLEISEERRECYKKML